MHNNKIKIGKSVKEACKGFKFHWIILCSASAIILITQSWLPKLLLNKVFSNASHSQLLSKLTSIKNSIISGHSTISEVKISILHLFSNPVTANSIKAVLYKTTVISIILALLLCFLYISVIYIANSRNRIKLDSNLASDIRKSPSMSLSYLFLSFLKTVVFMYPFIISFIYTQYYILRNPTNNFHAQILYLASLLLIFFFLLLSSVYIYIRLYFTGFIITEKSSNPFKAISKSWKLTRKNSLPLLAIFLITVLIDLVSLISIIGFIPATGLKYTMRASTYRQALEI